jgi:outer membrane protein OmpA-like peptidoglycan-associated protein
MGSCQGCGRNRPGNGRAFSSRYLWNRLFTGHQTVEEKNSKVLAEVLKYLKENSGSSVIIESHKMSGDQKEQWDLEITDKRAKAVTTWLVTHGIAPGRLEPKGLGRTKPITQNDTPLEVQQNERIELVQSPPHEGFSQVTR